MECHATWRVAELSCAIRLPNTLLCKLNKWFVANKLSISPFWASENDNIVLYLDGTVLQKVEYCKYLGEFFDNAMKWTFHIDYVYKNLSEFFTSCSINFLIQF